MPATAMMPIIPHSPSLMFTPHFHRPALLCLFTAALTSGLTSCSPSVSEIELKSAHSRAEAAEARLAKLESDIKALIAEKKELTGFTGPDYERQIKRAESLRQEKSELESIKAQVDGKVAHFTSETQRHRDALTKENP